jgi:hypothetical protein
MTPKREDHTDSRFLDAYLARDTDKAVLDSKEAMFNMALSCRGGGHRPCFQGLPTAGGTLRVALVYV